MRTALTGVMVLAAAVLNVCWTASANALNSDELKTTSEAVDTELSRTIVLRSVRMPQAFGKLLLDMDSDARLIDRRREVANLIDADVWVVGLKGWSDTQWLKASPLHKLFADHLHKAAPSLKFKSFQWMITKGQMLDVHFVNLNTASDLTDACLAEQIYRLSQRVVTSRRAGDLSLARVRARPLVGLAEGPANSGHCD
ncbi:MAG: hypothetical protein AAGK77_08540 [Pseudomonadota bacterium]